MAKLFSNFERGTLGANLTTGATTIDFTGSVPGFATLSGGDTRTLVLDPFEEQALGPPEIVYLTAYTAAATTGTITRAQEGTSDPGVTWPAGTRWIHTHTAADVGGGSGSGIELVASLNAPTSGSFDFSGLTLTGYALIEVYFAGLVTGTDDDDLWMRFRDSGGIKSGASYVQHLHLRNSNAGTVTTNAVTSTVAGLALGGTVTGLGSAAGETAHGRFTIGMPGSTTLRKHSESVTTYIDAGGHGTRCYMSSYWSADTNALEGFIITSANTNLTAGNVLVYGHPLP